jgi:hypothetical protein
MSAIVLDIFGQAFLSQSFDLTQKVLAKDDSVKTSLFHHVDVFTQGVSQRLQCPKWLWNVLLSDHEELKHSKTQLYALIEGIVNQKIGHPNTEMNDLVDCVLNALKGSDQV